MGTLVVVENVTLDGVMQAPGRPDEDPRNGFEHGGWSVPYGDDVMGQVMGERMVQATAGGALLLGRRTYTDFASFWPHQTDNPFTHVLDSLRKYVVSSSLSEPLPWRNSVLLTGDAVAAVARLKAGPENLTVLGSGELVRTLMRDGLVDEYLLSIHPLVLGSGQRLFDDAVSASSLQLIDSITTSTGVVIATYRPVPSAQAPRMSTERAHHTKDQP